MSMKLSYRDTLAELVRELKMKKKGKKGELNAFSRVLHYSWKYTKL